MKLIYLFLMLFVQLSFANESVIDNPQLLYKAPKVQDSILEQKITINRTFKSLHELITRLDQIPQITTNVQNLSIDTPIPVNVNIASGTIENLLNQTASKLGYTWSSNKGLITFNAINPESKITNLKAGTAVKLSQIWELTPQDRTLRNVFTKWSKISGWQLIWNVNADYPVTSSWTITGTFEHATNEVLKASQQTSMPLLAKMHDANKVLEIYSPELIK